jgi:ketosteroid isomerase-like protein
MWLRKLKPDTKIPYPAYLVKTLCIFIPIVEKSSTNSYDKNSLHMKNRFLFILLLATLLSCQSDPNNDIKKDEIKSILSDYYNAMTKKDLQRMKELTTPDFVLFGGGWVYNNESVLKEVEQLGASKVAFKFDSLNIHFGKTNISAYYFRTASFTIRDSTFAPVQFLESSTFEKQDGKWKLRFLHSSKRESPEVQITY